MKSIEFFSRWGKLAWLSIFDSVNIFLGYNCICLWFELSKLVLEERTERPVWLEKDLLIPVGWRRCEVKSDCESSVL